MSHDEYLDVFIGDPIAHRSEVKLLRALSKFSNEHKQPLLVFANFELSGRQFDFVVVTAARVVVTEVKSSAFPVRGNMEGMWEYATADGGWATVTNGYKQALQRKNILRDAMGRLPERFHPEAHVVFSDDIPERSDLTPGNFKVHVGGLADFLAALSREEGNPWSLEEWRQWAERQRLRRVPLIEALDNAPAELMGRYREALVRDYQPQADGWIAASDQQRDAIASALVGGSAGAFVTGPSGCGKTLMAKAAAVHLSRDGAVVLFVQAKDISESLADALKTEIALVADIPLTSLLKAVRQTSARACIFLDGINELPGAIFEKTLRGLKILARRYGAQLVVTSQGKRPAILEGLALIAVGEPDDDLKNKIATSVVASSLSAEALKVLAGVRSGLEARMVAELQGELGADATRSSLVDQIIRKRLGEKARTCYAGLRSFALQLFGQFSYSMTETVFDDIMIANGLGDEQCETMLSSGLLERRAGRISFFHEMFLFGCAAQVYAQLARSGTGGVSQTLNTAFAEALASDVLAAVDDETTACEILGSLTNADILAKCAMGESGPIARSASRRILAQAASQILFDIENLRLALRVSEDKVSVEWEQLPDYSKEEIARFCGLGVAAKYGVMVEEYLKLCRAMDARLLSERRRLDEDARRYNVGLRSASFGLAYLGLYSGWKSSFRLMVGAAQSFWEDVGQSDIMRSKHLIDLTSGELHFVVEHRHSLYAGHESSFCEELAEVITARFRREPYHVQLVILHAAGFVRRASDAALATLTEALQQLEPNDFHLFISTSIIEALKLLGALDEEAEEAREGIRDQLCAALNGEDDEDTFEQALSIYVAQFDHPFDGIYCEEVNGLSDIEKKRLVTRAFRADSVRHSLSLKWLATAVADEDDPSDAPLFVRYARYPEINPHWQDEIAVFVLATRFLARHGVELPETPTDDDRQRCFVHLRDIVRYAEIRSETALSAAAAAWEALLLKPAPIVISCLHDVILEGLEQRSPMSESKSYGSVEISRLFHGELLKIARQFLLLGTPALDSHGHKNERATAWAVSLVGEFGDRSDLGMLRILLNQPDFARSATAAIRQIEMRC
ncbi:IstB-like ATP binding protein [Rhizobium sp. NFR07]|uniref:NERD domain-containing protein n=1 Tax=Rhizobium sp. NFR07 TaxID=1566262 RepID=UPI0008E99E3C|nr:NERD domain-containing protein [Rhizobium sp. NFR07]SFB57080.1 IstB-like ATP binding protein [Rhizobium sp. NFR07]